MSVEEYIPFRLINKNSKYYIHSDDNGKGNIRLYNEINDKCQLYYFEKINNNLIIRNLNSGYFIHCDNNGKGNVRQYYAFNKICQTFEFKNNKIINDNSKYYMHADDNGKSNLRMYNYSNDICQSFDLIYQDNFNKTNVIINKFVNNTQELDSYLTNLNNPNIFCGINNKNWVGISNGNQMKPIFAYLKYIQTHSVPNGMQQSYTFKKIKGSVKSWKVSVMVTQSIGANIGNVQSYTSISLGFEYNKELSEQTEESWTQTVTGPITYYVFQPVIVYALNQNKGSDDNPFGTRLLHLTKDNAFITKKQIKGLEPNEADYIIIKNKQKWDIESIIL